MKNKVDEHFAGLEHVFGAGELERRVPGFVHDFGEGELALCRVQKLPQLIVLHLLDHLEYLTSTVRVIFGGRNR